MLADLGADVVKIERPGDGDDLRNTLPYKGREGHQDYFYANNRSKKSVTLDLKSPRDRDVAHALAGEADIVVENFAPGTAARLHMGWDDLKAVNPRLVYCSISGFGQTGPYRDRLALDPVIQAAAGVMSVTGVPDGPPMQVGAPLADVMAGMYAAYAVVGAGEGQFIDISMQDAMVAGLGPRMGETLQAGTVPMRAGNENPLRVPAETFRAADGRYITIICLTDRFWPPICRAIGREDLIDDPRYVKIADRVTHRATLNAMLRDIFATQPAAAWLSRLEAERVPFAQVTDYGEALNDPQIAHRGLIRELDHPISGSIRVVGPPWIMPGAEVELRSPPLLGEHMSDVLCDWLGWDDDKVRAFNDERDTNEDGE